MAALMAPTTGWALLDDKLEVFVQENISHDSNVFRISDKLDPCTAINDCEKGDTIFTTAVGFNLDMPISLQRLQLSYTWLDARYRHFKDLDNRGHAARAAYLWAITPRLTGTVSYQEQETLSSFANIQGRRPDLVTVRMANADAAWMMTPSWRLHGVATAAQTDHSDQRDLQNIENASVETGVSYVTAQENRIGVAVRAEKGRSPDGNIVLGEPFNNEYRQASIGVQGRWVVTGHSRLDGRIDYTKREYEQISSRNYSGPTMRAVWTWTPTGKITVATIAQRDVAPIEDVTASFVLVTGITVRPDWAITDKINLRGHFAYAKWEYKAVPSLGIEFDHKVKTAGVSLHYRPFTRVLLTGAYTREDRTSTLPLGDYKVDIASIEARIGF